MAEKNAGVQTFAGVQPDTAVPEKELCTVLYGYGRLKPEHRQYVDNYEFVGGIGKNIPRSVANAWGKGVRPDGTPAVSRIFIQAILPNDADESAFVQATGIQLVEPAKLAAMINASDAGQLIELLGKTNAVRLAEELLKNVSSTERK